MPSVTVEINPKKLRSLRASQQKSQPQIEEATGIPHGRLTQYECGRANARIEHVEKLALYYDVPAKSLISVKGINRLSVTAQLILKLIGVENLETATA